MPQSAAFFQISTRVIDPNALQHYFHHCPIEEERKESIRMDCFRSIKLGSEIPFNMKTAPLLSIAVEVTRNRDSISLLGFALWIISWNMARQETQKSVTCFLSNNFEFEFNAHSFHFPPVESIICFDTLRNYEIIAGFGRCF